MAVKSQNFLESHDMRSGIIQQRTRNVTNTKCTNM